MTGERAQASATAEREMITTRQLDAPRDLVFKVWTDPEHVARWWGPRGFTTTTAEMDVRPGGVWRFIMHGPDGRDFPNRIVFREVVEPERLVYDHSGDSDDDPVRFETTVTFDDRDGKTLLTLRALFETPEMLRQAVEEFGAEEGARQTLERLSTHLENTVIAAPDELIISRTFNAPPELVFRCWTEPEHFVQWWGPHGFETPHCKIDLRPGGKLHFNMRSEEHGMDVWAGGVFQVVDPPSRLIFTDHFADVEGNKVPPTHYGMSEAHPDESVISIDFVEHDGKTTMVMRHAIPAAAPEREGSSTGWSESFAKLSAYLAQQAA